MTAPSYAVGFDIHTGEMDPKQAFDAVCKDVRTWVQVRLLELFGTEQEIPVVGNVKLPNVDVQTNLHETETTAHWQMRHILNNNGLFDTTCQVGRVGNDLEFGIEIGSDRTTTPFRPRIVLQLLERYECSVGGRRVFTRPEIISPLDVTNFIDETLLDPRRELPVILVTPHNDFGYLVDAIALASRVAGLAEVHKLRDGRAMNLFVDKIGRNLGAFNGAIRIYWPQFRLGDDPFLHNLYRHQEIVDIGSEKMEHRLFRNVVLHVCPKYRPGPVLRMANQVVMARTAA